ncbi:MAG: AAA family ATPase [Dehalococcoidales bacterium]
MKTLQVIADAYRLADTFDVLPEAEAQPAAIIVSGLPGTGKSYFCRRLADRLPFLILESDVLRKQLFSTPTYSAEESAYLFRAIHRLMGDLLNKGIPLIMDATNLAEKHRERLYNIAERYNARLIIVQVKAPSELVQKRLKQRLARKNSNENSDADWAVYKKMKAAAEKINRRHFTVDTSKDIMPAIEKIVREANR